MILHIHYTIYMVELLFFRKLCSWMVLVHIDSIFRDALTLLLDRNHICQMVRLQIFGILYILDMVHVLLVVVQVLDLESFVCPKEHVLLF